MKCEFSQKIINSLCIVRTDKNNKIIFVSDGMCKLSGYSENELIGKDLSIFRDLTTKESTCENIWEMINRYGYWKGITRNRKKDGSIYLVSSEILKEYDKQGNHVGFYSINIDITDKIKNLSEFIFESNLFDIFFSNDQDLVVICLCETEQNLKSSLIDISKPLAKLLNTTKEDILKNKSSFVEILSKKSKYYNNQKKLLNDYKNGKDIFVSLETFNHPRKKFICKVDITEFNYRKKPAMLFKLIDITKEIKQNQELEKLNKIKNEFLANFSHEIRTPLNAITGFLELMKEQISDPTLLEYINIVLDNSKHLLNMVNDIIDFAAIDNNKIEIIPREFTLKDIQSTIEIFYTKSLEKEIDFNIYISPLLPEKMTQDILRIKQIISNLLSNAIKFTNYKGKITINVYNKKNDLFIIVEDNGIGMTKDQIKKIFEPFQQASINTELKYGGTGLGLAIVKKILEMMNGEITVESEKDIGTKFSVRIPLINSIERKIISKINIANIHIFAPSFSIERLEILKKYLKHFTDANIIINDVLPITAEENDIIIIFKDNIDINQLEKLTQTNKILLIKNFNDTVILNHINEVNLKEVNLPFTGIKLYDALCLLIHNKLLKQDTNNSIFNLNLELSGNILIAEDINVNILLIENILKKFPNLNYKIVKNGNDIIIEYLSSIKNNKSKYDMIFLDENMPGLNGSEVAKKIREYEKTHNIKKIPLISLTASRYENKNNLILMNIDEYLYKPINIKEFFSILLKYTSNDNQNSNIQNIKTNKIQKLKEIRDAFIYNRKNLNDLLNELSNVLKEDEFITLNKIIDLKDKLLFNKFYNQLIKNIRKKINN